jgi:hypothetical protein
MIRVSVIALTVAIAAASLVVPASAKSSHPRASPSYAYAAAAHHHPLYDVVPPGQGVIGGTVNSDDPSLTGGGSIGYNQNIYNW